MRGLRYLAVVVACLLPLFAIAIDGDVQLTDPSQVKLYEQLVAEVRCLVCQNQTIGDSNAPLASDLRREIREQVAAGRNEAEIKSYLTDRYGDFVLYKPRFGGPALLLWLAPAILLLGGVIMFLSSIRRRASLPVPSEHDDASRSS